MRFFALLALYVLANACQPLQKADRPYVVYAQDPEFFKGIVNDADSSEDAITLHDQSYPIDLKLYSDGRFYYFLKRLGDGWGTWKHQDGYIDLYAERKLFVMQFAIRSLDPNKPEDVALEFSDRFGPKYLKMQLERR